MGGIASKSKGGISGLLDLDGQFRTKPKSLHEREAKELFADKSFFLAVLAILAVLFGGALIIHLLGILPSFIPHVIEHETGPEWYYLNCMYFCAVTITTIGYGDLAPTTVGGKLFVIFYTSIGFGMIAVSLGIISQKFVDTADFTLEITRSFRKKKKKQIYVSSSDSKSTVELDELVLASPYFSKWDDLDDKKRPRKKGGFLYAVSKHRKIWIAFGFYLVMILGGAAIFNALEVDKDGNPWGYFNSIYFCFVTLATIGYGDYHPRKDSTKVFFIFYSLLGLGFLSFFLQTMGRKFLKDLGKRAQKELVSDGTLVSDALVGHDMVLKNLQVQMAELDESERAKMFLAMRKMTGITEMD